MSVLHSHLENKQHVIWDWNGTLLLDIEHAVSTTNRLLAEEGLPPTNVDVYKRIFRFPVIDYYRDIGFDTSPAKFADLCERFNRYFIEGVANCTLWPGAGDTLAHVKKAGKTQSVLSATEQGLLDHQMQVFALEHYFDHVHGIAGKAAGSKVQRGHELMAKVRIPAEHTIMIGDTDHDMEVAEALGIELILVEHGHQCSTRLRAIHPKVIKVF